MRKVYAGKRLCVKGDSAEVVPRLPPGACWDRAEEARYCHIYQCGALSPAFCFSCIYHDNKARDTHRITGF